MSIGILITLNNFLHDLASAVWFCGTLIIFFTVMEGVKSYKADVNNFVVKIYKKFLWITNISLAIVILGGSIRAFNYKKYEWAEALGRDQIFLLIVKHILWGLIVMAGIFLQIKLYRIIHGIKK